MSAEDVLAEQLCRVEFKLDLILRQLKLPSIMLLPMDAPGQSCPVCKQPVEYQVQVTKKVVTRRCGCKTGKVAPDMDLFTPPVIGPQGAQRGNQEPEGSRSEDGPRRP